MYSWERVAVRTERVYDAVADSRRDDSMLARLRRYYKCGMLHRMTANAWRPTAERLAAERLRPVFGCSPTPPFVAMSCAWPKAEERERRKMLTQTLSLTPTQALASTARTTLLCAQVRKLVRQDLLLHRGGR